MIATWPLGDAFARFKRASSVRRPRFVVRRSSGGRMTKTDGRTTTRRANDRNSARELATSHGSGSSALSRAVEGSRCRARCVRRRAWTRVPSLPDRRSGDCRTDECAERQPAGERRGALVLTVGSGAANSPDERIERRRQTVVIAHGPTFGRRVGPRIATTDTKPIPT